MHWQKSGSDPWVRHCSCPQHVRGGRVEDREHVSLYVTLRMRSAKVSFVFEINWVWSVIKNIIIIIKDHGQKVNLSYTEKKTQPIYPFYSTTWHKSLKLVHYWIQRNHQHALKSKHSKLTELSELHRHTQRISCFSSPLTAGARLKCTYWIFIKPCVISQGVGLYRYIIRMQPALFLELWFTHNPGLLGHSQPTAAAYQSLLKELSGSDTSRRQDALSWNLLAAWSLMCLS